MSIKDLFDKGHSLKSIKDTTRNDLVENVESHRYIDAYSKKRDRFVTDTDFATASNFARFGLAEEYYDTAIKRIYQTYPYDGSLAEKVEWENESTYLDLFIFENEYPRTNGFIIFNSSSHTYTSTTVNNIYSSSAPQYVTLYGGPHSDPGGDFKSDLSAGPSKTGVSRANIYHTASHRANNLDFDLTKGVTVEFWLKKNGWASTDADKDEYVFHNVSSGSSGGNYGSLRIRTRGKSDQDHLMVLIAESGSTSITFSHNTGLSNIADSKWHHYALTAKTHGADTISNLYVDGTHVSKLEDSSTTISAVTGAMLGAIGALAWHVSSSANKLHASGGWGNIVECAIDEFRYWKTERNAQQIGRFYRDQIGGGTNTDNEKYDDISNKVDLGVYFKFNEGITGVSSTDSTVLDYSGRISNGTFINYASECRDVGSAMVQSGVATKEFKDPIIHSEHADIYTLENNKQTSGSSHDHENPFSIYNSMPAWIMEQDERDSNNLKYLTQIIASYFDDTYLQIQKLSRLKDVNYPDDTTYEKPLPFADRLLSSRGFEAPELFADASELAKYLERDEKVLFEKKLYEVKNNIYQNIYNNLTFIRKSKGTYKSLRNFLRCFGIDEELVKLNIYSNNDTYKLKDNVTHTSIRKNYIDFDDLETKLTASEGDPYTATVYQYYDSSDSNSLSYIPATSQPLWSGSMMTIETEVIFPKRSIVDDSNYSMFAASGSSIFGLNAVNASNTDLTFNASNTINFNVVARKTDDDLRNVKFALESSGGSAIFKTLESSSSFSGTYDNEKWNLAFRLRPTKTKTDTSIMRNTGTGFFKPAASAYTYELYGVNYLSDVLQNEFSMSGTMSLTDAETFFTKPKRIFIGANRTNSTGSVQKFSDVKVSSTRIWLDYLPDEVIRSHARDANSYGALQPYRNTNDSLNTNYVPQISTLILNWTMDNVTGSNSSGQFLVEDFASGSTDSKLKFGDKWGHPISKYNYTGRGDKFTTDSNFTGQVVDVEFVQSAKLKLPEVVNSDDMIKILNNQDDVVFTRETTYVQNLLSIEKSMYQIISEEILRMFASVANFNNLIGEPVNRYRPHYKKMEKLRELFFQNVENERLDLDKFIEYFKWVDEAITIMITQLIPVSSNSVEMLRNMVESHILERNKYYNKFPTLEGKPRVPEASLRGIEELKYNWKFGHAPLNPNPVGNQDESCLWWKQRAERTGSAAVLTSGKNGVDTSKNVILKTTITEVTGTEPTLITSAGTKYPGSYYPLRSLARPIDLNVRRSLSLKAGSNPQDNNKHDFYKPIIKWGSDDDFIYLDADNEISRPVCNDHEIPVELNKKEFRMKALVMPAGETIDSNAQGTGVKDQEYTDAKSSLVLPFNIFSSSIDTGYRQQYISGTMPKIEFTNMHEDKYGFNAEIPMQGTFTEKHVGGMQHRHVNLNPGDDTPLLRPEGWHLQEFIDQSRTEYVLGPERFTNATSDVSTDISILDLPIESVSGDPGTQEYWSNGVNADYEWSFITGDSPSAGTGPDGGYSAGGYAYCEVLPSRTGQTFGLVTPLIDLLDVATGSLTDSSVNFYFRYHMHGLQIGNLKVQASLDPTFVTGVEDLAVGWSAEDGSPIVSTVISGEQHAAPETEWSLAKITTTSGTYGDGLAPWRGKRFYMRFLYTAGPGHLGDCAIDEIYLVKEANSTYQNSFKLFSPTFDNHYRPSALYTRDILAKRPINIRNIETTTTGSGAKAVTIAGNYLDRYEYVNTTSPEANDPWFIKNVDSITRTTAEMLGLESGSIEKILSMPPSSKASPRTGSHIDFTLPDRTYLTGTTKNRTRFKTRFSSPGGFEVMSRGFLDPAHEIYSVYNAMPWRNNWTRRVYNSQLQSHMGRFGVSTHDTASARSYESESPGVINANSYDLSSGDASKHKYHRNNIERLVLSGSSPLTGSRCAAITGSYFEVSDDDSLSFGDASDDSPFSISAWIKVTNAAQNFPIVTKYFDSATEEYAFEYISTRLYLYTFDGAGNVYESERTAAGILTAGRWYHVAATADSAGESKTMKLYVDGNLVSSDRQEMGTYTAMHNTSAKLRIGASDLIGGALYTASGSIDEVSIWSTELTAEEVMELYNGVDKGSQPTHGPVHPGPSELSRHSQYSNLVSWWRLGDTGDTVSTDGFITSTRDRKGTNHATGKNSPPVGTGPTGSFSDNIVTASFHNNGFVSHMVPRLDNQTRWITASLI